jgi:hypothetical protein
MSKRKSTAPPDEDKSKEEVTFKVTLAGLGTDPPPPPRQKVKFDPRGLDSITVPTPVEPTFTVTLGSTTTEAPPESVSYGGTTVTDFVCKAARNRSTGNKLKNGYGWLNGGGITWHHLLPQEFEAYFPTSINIHAAQYGIEINLNAHDAIHWAGWNEEWHEFLRADMDASGNDRAGKIAVQGQLKKMCLKYHGQTYVDLPTSDYSYAAWTGDHQSYQPWSTRRYY